MTLFFRLFKSGVDSVIDTSGICSIYIKSGGITTDVWLKKELFYLAIQTSVVISTKKHGSYINPLLN